MTTAGKRTGRPRKGRRGRPQKFGEPSRLIALTLPQSVIRGLHRIDTDVARAVVSLFRRDTDGPAATPSAGDEAALVSIGARRSLIAVSRRTMPELPGVAMIPFSETQAFLALSPGTSVADLELAIMDYLEEFTPTPAVRRALLALRKQLRAWRRDTRLRFETRSILIVESLSTASRRR
jgi:hypothetical protein